MFDYSNLSSGEFEELCKDILQKILGQTLRTYAPGRDGGIDATGNQATGGIVMQAKHFVHSRTDELVRQIKAEQNKIDRLKPSAYYIFCSRELTPRNVQEIYSCFSHYMSSLDHIFTKREIDWFLQQPQNRDVLNIHFKLWLQSTNVLIELLNRHIYVDIKVYMDNISADAPYFVSTKWYRESIGLLDASKIILITGDPGVGKSTLSKMLALHYVEKGYRLCYVSGCDADSMKAMIGVDESVKELVIMDDFLGQRYEDLIQVKDSALVSMLKYISGCNNKILIVNSRITVFNFANERFEKLAAYLKTNQIHMIQIGDLSKAEKAEILLSHLLRNEKVFHISHEYYKNIVHKEAYKQIISHRNYCPRMIEMATNRLALDHIQPHEFASSILTRLDNPEEVWEGEFANIGPVDRILLFTLCSLTQTSINDDVLKECFWSRIRYCSQIDTTELVYENILKRLIGSFIRFSENVSGYMVSFANPSIVDYITSIFNGNRVEQELMIRSAIYYEQLFTCCQKEFNQFIMVLSRLAEQDKILPFKSVSDHAGWDGIFAVCIADYKICKKCYQPILLRWLQDDKAQTHELYLGKFTYGDIAVKLFEEPMRAFYELDQFLCEVETYLSLIEFASIEDTIRLTDHILPTLDQTVCDDILPILCDQLYEMMCYRIECFDVDSFCQERFERNDYHEQLNRLWGDAQKEGYQDSHNESVFYESEYLDHDINDNDAPFLAGLLSEALHNMAVVELQYELQKCYDMIITVKFKENLTFPSPEEYLAISPFIDNVEGVLALASDFMTYLSLENPQQPVVDIDKVDQMFKEED